MKSSRSASARRSKALLQNARDLLRSARGQTVSRSLVGIGPKPRESALCWIVGSLVVCGILVINTETHSHLAPTVLYLSLLLMAANLFSIGVVILVALACMLVLIATFLFDGGYRHPDLVSDFFRCLTAQAAITLLAMRSKFSADSLRHNEAYLIGAQRLSQTGSIGFSAGRETFSWSDESARIFEYPLAERPTVSRVMARTHPDDRPMVQRVFDKAARHESLIEIKHRLLMPDGRIKHVHMIASPLSTLHGSCEYVGALMDVTVNRQAEETLFRTQSQLAHVTRLTSLGELAASIAHEVNQPLTAITSSGEACRKWLDRPTPELEEARESLDRIIASAARASDVIGRVRALARKCDPLRQVESLDCIVSETLSVVQHEIAHHRITPKVELAAMDGLINADRVQLQQVIINLIINACQAMNAVKAVHRALCIRTWVSGDEVVLEIADQGPGIPVEVLPVLFNPFFTTKENGLGIGLSICRSIIDFHGGRIWATSQPGEGASFLIALPLLGSEPS